MSHLRISWADNFKGFLILLVILGHVIQYSCESFDNSHLYNYIYSFHMPAFMAISAFLSYKSVNQLNIMALKRRGIQLLVPYIFWTLLFCAVMGISIWQSMFIVPVYWFLILLFIISVTMNISQWLACKLNISSEIVCMIVIVVLFFIHLYYKPRILSLNILFIHFSFYTMGWYLRKYEASFLRSWMIFPLGLLFIFGGWYYTRSSAPTFMSFFPTSFYFLITGTIGTLFFIMVFRMFTNKELFILQKIGKMTLGIYVVHLLLCCKLSNLFYVIIDKLGYFLGIIVLFTTMGIVSFCLVLLFEKLKMTRYLIGSR